MALVKNITTDSGVPTSYHRIGAIHYYIGKGIAHIDVESYYNQGIYEGGAFPVVTNQLEFSGGQCPFTTDNVTLAAAYTAVKTTEMFADAQDV